MLCVCDRSQRLQLWFQQQLCVRAGVAVLVLLCAANGSLCFAFYPSKWHCPCYLLAGAGDAQCR